MPVSALFTKQPAQVKLETLAALCTALECTPNDLIDVDTTPVPAAAAGQGEGPRRRSREVARCPHCERLSHLPGLPRTGEVPRPGPLPLLSPPHRARRPQGTLHQLRAAAPPARGRPARRLL